MKKKLMHERLREAADRTSLNDPRKVLNIVFEGECEKSECLWCSIQALEAIADEVERCYIPRPRYEDGEPVQFGDEAQVRDDLGEVKKMVFTAAGCEEVMIGFEYDSSASHYMVVDGEFVKRPEPKVLDADGVEVKVGDTVYSLLNDGEEPFGACYVVISIDTSRELPVSCGHRGQQEWLFKGASLTHREPDSLEKAMECFQSILEDKDGIDYEAEEKLWGVHKRLTALIERGA